MSTNFVPFVCARCNLVIEKRADIHEPCWRFIPPVTDSPEVIAAMEAAKRILGWSK